MTGRSDNQSIDQHFAAAAAAAAASCGEGENQNALRTQKVNRRVTCMYAVLVL